MISNNLQWLLMICNDFEWLARWFRIISDDFRWFQMISDDFECFQMLSTVDDFQMTWEWFWIIFQSCFQNGVCNQSFPSVCLLCRQDGAPRSTQNPWPVYLESDACDLNARSSDDEKTFGAIRRQTLFAEDGSPMLFTDTVQCRTSTVSDAAL